MAGSGLFIVHTRKPRFIAEVNEPDIEPVLWLDDPGDMKPERLAGLMRRMGDWYTAYTNWEDDESFRNN